MRKGIAKSAGVFGGAAVNLFVIFGAATPSRALDGIDPVDVSGTFNFSDWVGVNPVGNGAPIGSTGFWAGGIYDQIGANSVTPSAGTTVTATQGTYTYNVPFIGGPTAASPDEFSRLLPLNTSLTGPWTLTAQNQALQAA